MKALLAENYDAVFVGCGAAWRDLDVPAAGGRQSTSVS